jgi:hypothetical protein
MPRGQIPSRRSMLRGAAGIGAAAALPGIVLPGIAQAATTGPREPAAQDTGHRDARHHATAHHETAHHDTEHIVVHLHDVRTGRIDVFQGATQIELRDTDLAARIAQASRQVR